MHIIQIFNFAYFTWIGWVSKTDEMNDETSDVNHLATFSSPREMPFIKMKKRDTPADANDKIYAIILHL